ncbi:hypothetical protein EV401DRAFT_732281 [Pisolithus croceorrhizus]|nr:hypothetical protein EV401DRAFT_732281 [Pisolithus croceorrhizus]
MKSESRIESRAWPGTNYCLAFACIWCRLYANACLASPGLSTLHLRLECQRTWQNIFSDVSVSSQSFWNCKSEQFTEIPHFRARVLMLELGILCPRRKHFHTASNRKKIHSATCTATKCFYGRTEQLVSKPITSSCGINFTFSCHCSTFQPPHRRHWPSCAILGHTRL